jgi:hypothetical protein
VSVSGTLVFTEVGEAPNMALERSAGSHPLAAAAHRRRSPDNGSFSRMVGSAHG